MGTIGEEGGCKRVSGYFATEKGDGGASKLSETVVLAPGRNMVPKEEGGSWFKELEKSTTVEGKFIYRTELSDLTNNVRMEGRTETPRRNPFKVVAKRDKAEEVEAEVNEIKGQEEEEEEKVDSGIGSSQLSIYSIDADSLSFSQTSAQVWDLSHCFLETISIVLDIKN